MKSRTAGTVGMLVVSGRERVMCLTPADIITKAPYAKTEQVACSFEVKKGSQCKVVKYLPA